jgi:hypothetical protein
MRATRVASPARNRHETRRVRRAADMNRPRLLGELDAELVWTQLKVLDTHFDDCLRESRALLG